MATLAALSFSFARVVESDELKDRIMFAGERFLHGAQKERIEIYVLDFAIIQRRALMTFGLRPGVGNLAGGAVQLHHHTVNIV